MTLLRASEVEANPGDRVFRNPPWRAVLIAVALAASAAGAIVFGRGQPPGIGRYLPSYVGAFTLLALLFLQRYVTARFGAGNWLARTGADGVSVHFRSYLNDALPATDGTVVFIPYREIRSARLVKERTTFPDAQGRRSTQTLRYVEFDVSSDVSPLTTALAAERARKAPAEKHWYGTSSTLFNDYPVEAAAPSFVRVRWTASPGAAAFLEAIRPAVEIAPAVSFSGDEYSQLSSKSRKEQAEYLRRLDARGETVAAIYTARRLYGFGLADAKDFLDRLRAGAATGAESPARAAE